MPWGAIAGGLLSYAGAQQAGNAQRDAANSAADAGKFTPYNVYSGYGSGTFQQAQPGTSMHMENGRWVNGTAATPGSATATLNPQYAALRDQYLQQANGNLGAFQNYDPQAASADIYSKLAALSALTEARARTDLESRLQAQGMLGSTGGGIQQQALFDSQGQSRLARELQSYTTAQDTLNQMQQRGINATNAASGLDSLALQNLNLGGAFGGRAMQGSQFGANLQYQAASNHADSMANFWSGLGQNIAPAFKGATTGTYNDQSGPFGAFQSSQYSPNYGGAAYGGSSAYAP